MSLMTIGKFDLGDVSATATSPPKIEDFQLPLERVVLIQRAMNWWVGDLVGMGETLFGEEFYNVVPEGFGADHIARCTAVSNSIPRSSRVSELSWSHHREVARLPAVIQSMLLNKALESGMTSGELREAVKQWRKR